MDNKKYGTAPHCLSGGVLSGPFALRRGAAYTQPADRKCEAERRWREKKGQGQNPDDKCKDPLGGTSFVGLMYCMCSARLLMDGVA